jgi:elongation factor G
VTLNFRPFPRDYLPLEIAIEPKLPADSDRLIAALERMAAEDATLRPSLDGESGQTRLHMASESQIEAMVEAFEKEGVDLNVGARGRRSECWRTTDRLP